MPQITVWHQNINIYHPKTNIYHFFADFCQIKCYFLHQARQNNKIATQIYTMKKLFTDFFYYTRSERNGALLLSFFCLLFFMAPRFYPFIFKKPAIDFAEFNTKTAALSENRELEIQEKALFTFDPNTASLQELTRLGLSEKVAKTIINYRSKVGAFRNKTDLKKIYGLKAADYDRIEPFVQIQKEDDYFVPEEKFAEKSKKSPTYFPFDPNAASREDFQKLGLPDRLIHTLLNYREKGGVFRKNEDLQKIYGMTMQIYEQLAPYIQLKEAKPFPTNAAEDIPKPSDEASPKPKKEFQEVALDINKASIEDWQKLRGIGASYAKRIINFRDKLGGFANIEQVKETYGLPDSTFQKIKPQLYVSAILRHLSVNTATADELKNHPYLDYKSANAIVAYRAQHGRFGSFEDLKNVKAISAEKLEKVKPYLKFD